MGKIGLKNEDKVVAGRIPEKQAIEKELRRECSTHNSIILHSLSLSPPSIYMATGMWTLSALFMCAFNGPLRRSRAEKSASNYSERDAAPADDVLDSQPLLDPSVNS